jgi:hypothetical protein
MKWTLLVPGALLPASLAPEIARAIHTPRLVERLRLARRGNGYETPEADAGAAHWAWLARELGLGAAAPVTAPYAWASSAEATAATQPEAAAQQPYIAHCDPVHMAIARDHLLIAALDAPLREEETQALLALANEAATQAAQLPALRVAVRAGRWFLLAAAPLDLQAGALDAVLGRPLQERLPGGAHARALRMFANEVQMMWHASEVNAAREARGERTVNAFWIHGGGPWTRLAPRGLQRVRADDSPADAAILRGWQQAGAQEPANASAPGGGRSLALFRGLHGPRAHQSWDEWLAQLAALEACVEAEAQQAQRQGAAELELALCGEREVRTLALSLRSAPAPLAAISAWARRWPLGRTAGGRDLAGLLAESAPQEAAATDSRRAQAEHAQ